MLFCLVACDPDEPSRPVIVDGGSPDGSKTTRPRNNATTRASGVTGSSVSLKDVYAYIDKDCPRTKAAQPSQASVEPYIDNQDQDTLMYIVNYPQGQGWKVLSADSRTPAIIAEGDKGSFDLNGADGAVAAWMSCVATDMKRVRHARDEDLNFSDIEIACNKAFWTGEQPRIIIDDPIGNQGYWVETTTTQTEFVDSIAHMTPHWSQRNPYNQYCPIKTEGPGGHAFAGCVAIAGANVLYYLHNRLGIPETMVDQATYDSNEHEWFFTGSSDTIWASMDTTSRYGFAYSNRPEALMIGYIGKTINMNYGGGYSWVLPANLRTNLFYPNGIDCDHDGYDESIVANSLLNHIPVIITATNLLIPVDFDIHCFVADAYKRTRIKYITWHHWVGPIPLPDPGESSIILEPGEYDDYNTYSYSSPAVTAIKINWGWCTQWHDYDENGDDPPLNDGWYSLTGNWTVNNGGIYDYNHNRTMIYGFATSN